MGGDRDEGCAQVMESFTSQEEEVGFSEEGNRKLLWVLVETVTGWKLRPTQGCSRGSGLLSVQMDTLCHTLGMFSKDGLCKACPLPTPTAWLQPVF